MNIILMGSPIIHMHEDFTIKVYIKQRKPRPNNICTPKQIRVQAIATEKIIFDSCKDSLVYPQKTLQLR